MAVWRDFSGVYPVCFDNNSLKLDIMVERASKSEHPECAGRAVRTRRPFDFKDITEKPIWASVCVIANRRCSGSLSTQLQRIFWSDYVLNPSQAGDTRARRLEWRTTIDLKAFRRAFEALVERTDALRLVFGHHEGVPYQSAAAEVDSALLFNDFSHLPDPDTAAHLWLDELSERVFDLSRCSFNAAIIKLEPQRWLFFINQHHIATDFSSVAILVRRLDILYRAALEGSIENTGPFPSFVDFLDRHPEVIGRIDAKRHGQPANRIRRRGLFGLATALAPARYHRHEVLVGAERLARLRRFCLTEIDRGGVDFGMFDVLAAAYCSLLIRASADESTIIGTTYANRYLPDAKDVAGPLIRMVPLQIATAEFAQLPHTSGIRHVGKTAGVRRLQEGVAC